MGNTLTCGLGSLPSKHVVKLIHSNGLVEEFHRPVKARELTVDYPHHFIFNSEDLILSLSHGDGNGGITNHNSLPSNLSDDEEMEIGQMYFLLPKTMFDHDYRSSQLDLSAIASIASKARKSTSHRRRSGLHASMKQLAPLPQLPPSSPSSPGLYLNAKAEEDGGDDCDKNAETKTKKTTTKDVSYPPQLDTKADDPDADQKVKFSKEFVQKLLAETKLKLQSNPRGILTVDPSKGPLSNISRCSSVNANTDTVGMGGALGVMISAEMQTAYTRHILDRSFARLWRPPLDTIAEDHQILFLS